MNDISTANHAAARRAFAAGIAHHRAGEFAPAIEAFTRAASLDPGFADAHNNLGVTRRKLGQDSEAVTCFARAVGLDPGRSDYRYNLGNALRALGKAAEAIAEYERALAAGPASAALLSHLGLALRESGKPKDAAARHRQALALEPRSAPIHNNLGAALLDAGRSEAALAHFRRAIAIDPGFALAHANAGIAATAQGDFAGALASFRAALAIAPNLADALAGMGQALASLGELDQGLALIDRALAIAPAHLDAALGRARALLLLGRFGEGWDAYEARWRRKGNAKPPFPGPEWDGADPRGRTLLVYGEQGLGDTIQFSRYVPLLAERGARVILRAPGALTRLMDTLAGVGAIAPAGTKPPAHDAHVPVLSLPRLMGTTPHTIPSRVPYLRAPDGVRVELPSVPEGKARIGIAWAGNPQHQNDRFRSMGLSDWMTLVARDAQFLSLQKGPRAADIAVVGAEGLIVDLGGKLGDFADTAAVLAQLDLVICVDTALAHLAGALGRPVWTLLPAAPDWRWLGTGEDTPWYPTMRLFRQARLGDWSSVVARVARALDVFLAAHRGRS